MNCPATQLSLKTLRKDGWSVVEKVETWVPFPPPGHRKDLFGLFDIIAVGPDSVIGVQATSKAHVSARLKKMRQNPTLEHWLASPSRRAEVWGWFKEGRLWKVKRVPLKEGVNLPPSFDEPQTTNWYAANALTCTCGKSILLVESSRSLMGSCLGCGTEWNGTKHYLKTPTETA